MDEALNNDPGVNAIGDRRRDIKAEGGFAWFEKEALDRILLKTSGVETPVVIAVYMALCRLASDRGNAVTISAGMGLIAKQAGCSRRSVIRAIPELERIKLIRVGRSKRGAVNDENSYALLACGRIPARNKVMPVSQGHSDSESLGVVSDKSLIPGTLLKESISERKSGVETPASFGAVAPSAVDSPPSGNGIEQRLKQPKPKKRQW